MHNPIYKYWSRTRSMRKAGALVQHKWPVHSLPPCLLPLKAHSECPTLRRITDSEPQPVPRTPETKETSVSMLKNRYKNKSKENQVTALSICHLRKKKIYIRTLYSHNKKAANKIIDHTRLGFIFITLGNSHQHMALPAPWTIIITCSLVCKVQAFFKRLIRNWIKR